MAKTVTTKGQPKATEMLRSLNSYVTNLYTCNRNWSWRKITHWTKINFSGNTRLSSLARGVLSNQWSRPILEMSLIQLIPPCCCIHAPVDWVSIVVQCRAIAWTSAGLLWIGPLGTNFNEIRISKQDVSIMKMHLKLSSAKWWPICQGETC